jgi:hypothetical protein
MWTQRAHLRLATARSPPPPPPALVCEGGTRSSRGYGRERITAHSLELDVAAFFLGVLVGFLVVASCILSTIIHRPCTGCLPYDLCTRARKYVKFPFSGSRDPGHDWPLCKLKYVS